MAEQTLQNMTLEELESLIEKILNERTYGLYEKRSKRTFEEVYASIEKHRWTPPPGSPSTLELLREDRDQ